jgi:hypothetical protein
MIGQVDGVILHSQQFVDLHKSNKPKSNNELIYWQALNHYT